MRTWVVASLEKMEVNLEYLEGRMDLGLVFSASMVSLVAVVREVTWRVVEMFLQEAVPHQIAQYMM